MIEIVRLDRIDAPTSIRRRVLGENRSLVSANPNGDRFRRSFGRGLITVAWRHAGDRLHQRVFNVVAVSPQLQIDRRVTNFDQAEVLRIEQEISRRGRC